MNIINKIIRLRNIINKYNYLYYVLGKPITSDRTYDKLSLQLFNTEKKYLKRIDLISPTKQIGFCEKQMIYLKQDSINDNMLSLEKAFSKLDIINFQYKTSELLKIYKKKYVICEPKIDGLAVILVYKNKVLLNIVTRKDGIKVIDEKNVIDKINNVPKFINKNGTFYVKGELYISKKHFFFFNYLQSINKKKQFVNTRHACFAFVKRPTAKKIFLGFVAYDIKNKKKKFSIDNVKNNQYSKILILKKLGFQTPFFSFLSNKIENIAFYNFYVRCLQNKLPYFIDGVVYKINSLIYQNYLGSTFKHPKWSLAYKFPEIRKISKIKVINFQISRNGSLIPVAYIYPVKLDDAIIRKSSIHSLKEIIKKKLDISKYILIKRSGYIIPNLIRTIKKNNLTIPNFYLNKYCISCYIKLIILNKYTNIYCGNLNCLYKFIIYVNHFFSKNKIYINGLNINLVKKLVFNNFIKNIFDLYIINYYMLKTIPEFEGNIIENLQLKINNSKIIFFNQFICALSIFKIGEKKSLILSLKFNSIKSLQLAKFNMICNTIDLGKKIAFSLKNFFLKKKNILFVNNFLKKTQLIRKKLLYVKSKLRGKKILITGKLSKITRKYIDFYFEKLSTIVKKHASKDIEYIIIGRGSGKKYSELKNNKIKILTEKKVILLIHKLKNMKL